MIRRLPWMLALVLAAEPRLQLVPHALPARLENFPTVEKFLPETMAGGLVLFDYDNDGRLDVFIPNGAALPAGRKAPNRLFHNDGGFRFTDVTDQSGLAGAGFAFGGAAADFDGDGFVDLYVAAWPHGQLWHNRGDGTFEDWTARAGLLNRGWNIAAGWFDFDRDGRPDLFLVNYLDWSPDHNPFCGDRERGVRVYCHPRQFAPQANQLYRNLGGGRFADVSDSSGIGRHLGKGMSVVFGDADGDGWLDAFVTNDSMPSFLFLNQRNGTFREAGLEANVSLPESGRSISAMGADFRDFDNDGRDDLVISALARETFPLFRNLGRGLFRDVAALTQLTAASLPYSGWGVALADLDNDGFKEIVTANSHVNDRIEQTSADRYLQPNTIFVNHAGRRFTVVPFGEARAHRGLAVADLDNDGRLDVVVTALGEPPEIWRNVSADNHAWLDLDAPPGTLITIGAQRNRATSATGYSSSVLAPVHFGLGNTAAPVTLEIVWPDGRAERRSGIPVRQRVVLKPLASPKK